MKASLKTRRIDLVHSAWLSAGLIVACGLFASTIPSGSWGLDGPAAALGEFTPASFKPIEEIRVGERVLTDLTSQVRNVATDDVALPAWDCDAIDPAQWRRIELTLTRDDGSAMEIVLLRPLEWITQNNVAPGKSLFLSLPEMRQEGIAAIRHVAACPPIQAGPGRVVTGTFSSTVDEIVAVYLDNLAEPIRCTPEHPFYRLDDQRFVAAGELRSGDRLKHLDGTATVERLSREKEPRQVYNLEIQRDHVYRVSPLGVLVHNVWNVDGGSVAGDGALDAAKSWLRDDYRELNRPGVFRGNIAEPDGTFRQFRMTDGDLTDPWKGPHVHFETIAPNGRDILENAHVGLLP